MMLTYHELTTVVSRFQSSMRRLKKEKDYVEDKSDRIILDKLIDMKYDAGKEEGVF